MDLTRLVTGGGGSKSPYDELANEIGKSVYADIGGWHLYSRDLSATPTSKMSTALAMSLGPKASQNGGRLSESEVIALLKTIPVKIGGGKGKVTPSFCIGDLARIVEDYSRRK